MREDEINVLHIYFKNIGNHKYLKAEYLTAEAVNDLSKNRTISFDWPVNPITLLNELNSGILNQPLAKENTDWIKDFLFSFVGDSQQLKEFFETWVDQLKRPSIRIREYPIDSTDRNDFIKIINFLH